MNAKQLAAEDLKKLAKLFRGILALTDDIELSGSLDQAVDESKRRLEVARLQEADAKADLILAEVQKDQAQSDTAIYVDQAKDAKAKLDAVQLQVEEAVALREKNLNAAEESRQHRHEAEEGVAAAKKQMQKFSQEVKEKLEDIASREARLLELKKTFSEI